MVTRNLLTGVIGLFHRRHTPGGEGEPMTDQQPARIREELQALAVAELRAQMETDKHGLHVDAQFSNEYLIDGRLDLDALIQVIARHVATHAHAIAEAERDTFPMFDPDTTGTYLALDAVAETIARAYELTDAPAPTDEEERPY